MGRAERESLPDGAFSTKFPFHSHKKTRPCARPPGALFAPAHTQTRTRPVMLTSLPSSCGARCLARAAWPAALTGFAPARPASAVSAARPRGSVVAAAAAAPAAPAASSQGEVEVANGEGGAAPSVEVSAVSERRGEGGGERECAVAASRSASGGAGGGLSAVRAALRAPGDANG